MPRERHTPQAQSARPAPDALHARAPSPSRSFPHNAPDDPSSTGQRRPTLPSFVYRQEVFELSIYAASSIAHAHEESNRGLAISHKRTTWAKVDFHDAWRCSATDSFQMNDLALRAAILSAKPSEGAEMPENATANATTAESQVVIPEVLPMEGEATFAKKAKGIAQVAAGSALTAAGIPMLVLPGPGVAAIVGGAALVSRGNRNYTGRTATPFGRAPRRGGLQGGRPRRKHRKTNSGQSGREGEGRRPQNGSYSPGSGRDGSDERSRGRKRLRARSYRSRSCRERCRKKRCSRSKAPVHKREEDYRGGHLISKARRARHHKEKQVTWAPAKSCRRQCRRVESRG